MQHFIVGWCSMMHTAASSCPAQISPFKCNENLFLFHNYKATWWQPRPCKTGGQALKCSCRGAFRHSHRCHPLDIIVVHPAWRRWCHRFYNKKNCRGKCYLWKSAKLLTIIYWSKVPESCQLDNASLSYVRQRLNSVRWAQVFWA